MVLQEKSNSGPRRQNINQHSSMDQKAANLRSSAYSLQRIHEGAAKLKHAIWKEEKEDWELYFPNHFIYSFLAFNSLYNVDWTASYNNGRIAPVRKVKVATNKGDKYFEEKEGIKQEMYLSFCFQNLKFVKLYKDFFTRCVLKGDTAVDVKEMLSEIRLDSLPNGSVRTENYVRRFRFAVDDLLTRGRFDKDTISIILDYIYSVRCNLFHGVKSIDEMKDYGQQDRFDIYASFIIALNQMVFSYLDYLIKGDSFTDSFDDLFNELM